MDIKCKFDELLTLNKIIANPKNPNYHSHDSIKLLAGNIDYQGIRWPIIISRRSGFIAAGHGRLEAAKLLKYEHFPVVYQDFESEAQEYEFLVADNRLGELSEIDKTLVLEAFEELPELKIEMLGFDEKDLGINGLTVNEINNSDENSEWVKEGMPDFNPPENMIRIMLHFKNEEDRSDYVLSNNLNIDRRLKDIWISHQ